MGTPYTYRKGDVIIHNAIWYYAKNKTAPGQSPLTHPLLYDKFPTGPQGIQGVQGIQGIQGIQGVKGDKGDAGTIDQAALKTLIKQMLTNGELTTEINALVATKVNAMMLSGEIININVGTPSTTGTFRVYGMSHTNALTIYGQ
jgi:hypothetical protein